jgi:hypothetical protein
LERTVLSDKKNNNNNYNQDLPPYLVFHLELLPFNLKRMPLYINKLKKKIHVHYYRPTINIILLRTDYYRKLLKWVDLVSFKQFRPMRTKLTDMKVRQV